MSKIASITQIVGCIVLCVALSLVSIPLGLGIAGALTILIGISIERSTNARKLAD